MLINVVVILVLIAAIYLLARPVVRGAMFFPTSVRNVEVMVDIASLRRDDRIVDLGSGDGRILIACAERGIHAEGYEINPILVLLSRSAIRRAGLRELATVHWKSFWRVDLAPFNAIFIYGMPRFMGDLQKKFERELRPGTKIVANISPLPGWKPAAEREKVYLYKIGTGHR
jgi:precorrin-6B methylase 2